MNEWAPVLSTSPISAKHEWTLKRGLSRARKNKSFWFHCNHRNRHQHQHWWFSWKVAWKARKMREENLVGESWEKFFFSRREFIECSTSWKIFIRIFKRSRQGMSSASQSSYLLFSSLAIYFQFSGDFTKDNRGRSPPGKVKQFWLNIYATANLIYLIAVAVVYLAVL